MCEEIQNIVEYVEQCFLEMGVERMSKYFGDEVFENGIPAKHVLWNKDEYYFIVNVTHRNDIEIKYSKDIGDDYERYDLFSADLEKEEIKKRIISLVNGWTPEQERILSKYIDLCEDITFPFVVQGIVINKDESLDKKQFKYIETERITYSRGLNSELDRQYNKYVMLLEDEFYSEAIDKLQVLYINSCNILGAEHPNAVSLLYEIRDLASVYLDMKNVLKINLILYQHIKKIYGNMHLATLCIISCISAILCDLEKYEDAIVLAKFVQRACEKKYGKMSGENIDALGCLASHYYTKRRYGKALSYAKKCLEYSNLINYKDALFYKQYIAKIYRTEAFKDFESALLYDLEVYEDIIKRNASIKEILECIERIVHDYMGLGRINQALQMQASLVELAMETYDISQEEFLEYYTNFSFLLSKAGKYEEALKVSKSIYYQYLKNYGKFYEKTMEAMNNLIIDMVNNNEREEAMKLAGMEYLQRKEELGQDNEFTLYSMQQYIDLRDNTPKEE